MTWREGHDQPDGPAEAAPDPAVVALVRAARAAIAGHRSGRFEPLHAAVEALEVALVPFKHIEGDPRARAALEGEKPMTAAKDESAKPLEIVEIMARRRKPHFDELLPSDQERVRQLCLEQVAALEDAGFRIVHPERVTFDMGHAAQRAFAIPTPWKKTVSEAIAAAPTYATPAAPQKE